MFSNYFFQEKAFQRHLKKNRQKGRKNNTDNEGDADYDGEGEDEEDTTGATNESLAAEEQAGRREETECKEAAATDNSDIANTSKVLDFLA